MYNVIRFRYKIDIFVLKSLQMSEYKNSKYIIRLPLIIAITLSLGVFIGAKTFSSEPTENNTSNPLDGALKFREILTYIYRDYVDTVNTNDLVEHAIIKMLEKLDPHTAYIAAKDRELAQTQLESNFEGIGIQFDIIKDTLYVVTPISGGPSEAVGLQSGDKIIKIDDKLVAGIKLTNRDVFDKLRGKKGSKVTVSIKRGNTDRLIEFTITRDKIPTYSVDAKYMIKDEIGYIKINRFGAETHREFKEALVELESKGMKKLLLDLRYNSGGYLDQAIKMIDELLKDDELIVYTDGKGTRYDSKYFANTKGVFEKGDIIVMINEGSASASEILAGAVQDNDRGLIVGRRSYGKGLVQAPINLTDGSELRLTISRYYTPSGRSIQRDYGEGIDEYHKDILKRFEGGEFFSADSINFNDSLKYQTKNGRTVYGGGGIMPDFFIPRDTSDITEYYNQLFAKSLIRKFSIELYGKYKKQFVKMTFNDFEKSFTVSDEDLSLLNAMAINEGIKFNQQEFLKSKESIRNQLKARIANSAFGSSEQFIVFNKEDKEIQQALSLFVKINQIIKK